MNLNALIVRSFLALNEVVCCLAAEFWSARTGRILPASKCTPTLTASVFALAAAADTADTHASCYIAVGMKS